MAEKFDEFFTSVGNDFLRLFKVTKLRNIHYNSYYTEGSKWHKQNP